MSTFLTLLLDGLLLVLLTGTIVSATRLNARLKALRDVRQDFAQMVAQFDDATRRADNGIKALQVAARQSGDTLQPQLDRAVQLRDELAIMLDSAENLAKRLERSTPTAATAPTTPTATPTPPPPDPRSKAERELLRALKGDSLP